MSQAKLGVGNTLQAARVSFEENRSLIVRLTIAFSAVNAVSTLLDLAGPAGLAISLGITVLLGAAYGGMVTAMICLPGKTETPGEAWAAVRPVLARLIWVSLLTALAVLAGLFALIIPGLIILTLLSVAGQSVVVERIGVFDSFGRSFELVKKTAAQVFGYVVVLALLSLVMLGLAFLVALPLGTGPLGTAVGSFLSNLVSTPILAIGSAALYNQLTDLQKTGPEEETEPPAPL
jgi:hypothetical protein